MPNFWTNTTERLYEMFNGPRTKDAEYDLKFEQFKQAGHKIDSVREIYEHFPKNTIGFKTLCEEIVTSLTSLYDVSSPYWSVINEIIFIYGEADKIYDYLALQVVEIHKTCSAFDLKYKEVMSEVQKREDARRTYDHYDQKMQKLVKKREEKASKYELETHKDFEYFGRNQSKYKEATEKYAKLSYSTFHQMSDLIHYRHNYINPTIVKFINEHKRYFQTIAELFRRSDFLETNLQAIDQVHTSMREEYYPLKYIRGSSLIDKDILFEQDGGALQKEVVISREYVLKPLEPIPQPFENIQQPLLEQGHKHATDILDDQSIRLISDKDLERHPIEVERQDSQMKMDILNESDIPYSFRKSQLKEYEIIEEPAQEEIIEEKFIPDKVLPHVLREQNLYKKEVKRAYSEKENLFKENVNVMNLNRSQPIYTSGNTGSPQYHHYFDKGEKKRSPMKSKKRYIQ